MSDPVINYLIHKMTEHVKWDIYEIRKICHDLLEDVNDHEMADAIQTLFEADEKKEVTK